VLDGIHIHPKDTDTHKYKAVQDKDGGLYAQGVRIQTDKIELVNRRLQSIDPAQTEAKEEGIGTSDAPPIDEAEFSEFLRTVVPLMEQELGCSWRSQPVFEAYKPVWEDAGDTCELTNQVWQEGLTDFQVSSVAWDCTGEVLACSFARLETLTWCDAAAPVCCWNFGKGGVGPATSNTPDLSIEINGFVMCLAFHPTQPGLLAGGSYNGELMIWKTSSKELDPLVASSTIDDFFHREAIQSVQWIPADLSGNPDSYLLATVSGDGKVLIWDARENDLSYPSRGFTLTSSAKKLLGGRSLSFSLLDPWVFVVGCEAGTVLRGFRPPPGASMGKPSSQYNWKPSAVALLDQLTSNNARLQLQHHVENYCRTTGTSEVTAEIIFKSKPNPTSLFPEPQRTDLEAHSGAVSVVTFSPFDQKLLLTCATDGAVKLFDVRQPRPFLTFYPPSKHLSTCSVATAAWSQSRPGVFAIAMEMGGVYIYDLMQSQQEPTLELPLAGAGSQKITALQFNPKVFRTLVIGDASGRTKIFRLPVDLSERQPSELATIRQLMSRGSSEGDSKR